MAKRTKSSAAKLEREINEAIGEAIVVSGEPATIVTAWTERAEEVAPGQRLWRHDLGERPKLVEVTKPYAAMWLNRGSAADVVKARAYIQKTHPDTGRVLVYPVTERDPLGRARRDILTRIAP